MATGFETRQPGRDSFASQGPAPQRIGRGTLPATHRDVQVVGGDAAASGTNVQISTPGSGAAEFGEFLGKAMQPYVERKQQQRFFEGFTRAQSGEAIEELSKSHKGVVGQLFGPTPLEKGAQFYTGMKKVDDWQNEQVADMDNLKKLTPQELSKHLADTSLAMMGDDPFVNQLVQKQLIDKTAPLVDTIAKHRYSWQQDTARKGMFDALTSSGDSLQKMSQAIKDVTDPTDDESAAMELSTSQFLGSMQQPAGMSDETYRATLGATMESMAQRGNFYAYRALEDAGIFNVLDDDGQEKVLKAYDRFSAKALDDAKGNYIDDVLRIEERIAKTDLGEDDITPLQASAELDRINAAISRDTGIRERAYDSSAIIAGGKRVIDMIHSRGTREEERKYQEGWDEEKRKRDRRDKEREAAQEYSTALDFARLGKARSGLASGLVKPDQLTKAYFNLYAAKDFKSLARSFDQEHYFDNEIGELMQSKLTTAGGVTLTGEAKQGFEEFKALNAISPGAATKAYGDHYPRLVLMDRLIDGKVPPEQAYQRAFADLDKRKYPGGQLRAEDRKETTARIATEVANKGSSWFSHLLGFGSRPMGAQANRLISDVVTDTVAGIQKNGSLSVEAVTEQAVKAADGSSYEFFGGNMAWRHNGKASAAKVIGATNQEFGDTLYSTIDDKFQATGRRGGAELEYEILRTDVAGGKFILTVHPTDPDDGIPIVISSDELKARHDAIARGEVSGNQHGKPFDRTRLMTSGMGPF